MIVARIVKRLEEALVNKDTQKLVSIARDIGDEIVRGRTEVLTAFLSDASEVVNRLKDQISITEQSFLMAVTNIVSAGVDRLREEENRAYLKRISERYRNILDCLSGKYVRADEIALALNKQPTDVYDALMRLELAGLVDRSGIKDYWSLTIKGTVLLKAG